MKFLITGGAGFIGSHLAKKLAEYGDEIVIVDNLSTSSIKNLATIPAKFNFIEGDILNEHLISTLAAECDQIVHLAASLGVYNIINKPLESLKVNVRGTEIVLEAAAKFGVPILLASTSEIYGKNEKVPLNEEDDRIIGHPLKSRWSYSEAKAVDESLAYFHYLENNLPIRIVRLFNTVGPMQIGQYGMVLPRFVSAALKNDPLEVYGTGEQIRCFCHVEDTVGALISVMGSKKSIGEVFNVGNNQQISILELAKKVIQITGSKSEIVNISYSEAYPAGFEDMQRRVPDISKIKQVLGWSPKIKLEQIITDIVDFNSK